MATLTIPLNEDPGAIMKPAIAGSHLTHILVVRPDCDTGLHHFIILLSYTFYYTLSIKIFHQGLNNVLTSYLFVANIIEYPAYEY